VTGRARLGFAAALFGGLALLTVVVAAVGYRSVGSAIATVGGVGFLVFTAYWLFVVAILGLAWLAVSPGIAAGRLGVLIWARLVREAGSDILPFAQVSGFVLGARAAQAQGLAEDVVGASAIADITTELAAQVVYTLAGVALLVLQLRAGPAGAELVWPMAGALAFLAASAVFLVAAQRRGVSWLGRLAERWLPDSAGRAAAVRARLDAIYGDPLRVSLGVAIHLSGWVASGVGSWIALRFMGAHAPVWAVLAVEALMYAARSAAFVIPGGLGVQEGVYVLLAPLFGLSPGDVLALSLIRRARDLVIGVPVLLVWQARESRALFAPPPDDPA
jgi:putative membrane protein